MKSKMIGYLIIVIGICIIVYALVYIFSRPSEQEIVNRQLREEDMISLLKSASYTLTRSENLVSGSITDESMIKFAACYMTIMGDEYASYINHNEDEVIIANKEKIEEVVNYLFNRSISYDNISFNINNGNIYVSLDYHGGDMQVYKFKEEVYNEVTNTYTVYIDVLESGANRLTKLSDPSIIDYNEEDVMATMIFKYEKAEDGRQVLLAFNIKSNW